MTGLKRNHVLSAFRHVWPGCGILVIFSLLIAACFNPLSGKGGNAEFSISFGGGSGSGGISKAVAYPPDENPGSMALLKFTAIFAPAGGGEAKRFSSSGSDTVTGMIPAGTYNVSVEITLLSNESIFAKGTAVNNPVAISAGSPNTIDVAVEQAKFSVTFDLNGGNGTVPSKIIDIAASNEITLPGGTGLNKSGLFFGGWNTQADGTGTTYSAGSPFTAVKDTVLYVKWLDINDPAIVVGSTGLTGLKVGQSVSSASIVYTLNGGTYAASITAANFAVSNLPSGLTADTAVRTSNTVVTVPITGTPTTYNASTRTITLPSNIPAANVTGATGPITLTGTVPASAVAMGDGAAVSGAPTVSSYTHNSITVNAVTIPANPGNQTVEYARNTATTTPTSGWQDGTTFSGLAQSTAYYVFARSKSNANYNAGTVQRTTAATTTLATPTIAVTVTGLGSLQVGVAVSSASVVYTLSNGTYADPITAANFTVTGLPAGLGAGTATRTSNTVVTIPITGTPTTYSAGQVTLTKAPSIPAANVTSATAAITPTGTITASAVARGAGAVVSGAPTVSSFTYNSITVNAVTISGANPGSQTVEYAAGTTTTAPTSGWTASTTISGLSQSTAYYVFARSAQSANGNYAAGTEQRSTTATTTAVGPAIAVTATGLTSLKVGQAVSGSIVYTLSNATYAASITAANFTVSGLPTGLNAGTATRTSGTVVTIPVTGTPTTYSVLTRTVTLPTSIPAANVTGATGPIIPTGIVTASAVAKGDGAAVSGPPARVGNTTSSSITVSSVTNSGSTGQTVEYAASTTSGYTPSIGWQSGVAFSNLNAATTYYVYARTAENDNYNAGVAQQSDGIQTALAPAITVGTVVLSSLSVGSPINPVSVVYTLTNGSYANPITPGDFVLSNLPSGLSQSAATRNGLGTTVTVIISGAPTAANASSTTVNLPAPIPSGNVNLATAPIAVSGSITAGPIDKGQAGYAYVEATTVTSTSITVSGTVSTNQPIEFAINNTSVAPTSGWQLGTPGYTFSGLSPGTTYYIFARSAENANYYAQTLSPDWYSITTNP